MITRLAREYDFDRIAELERKSFSSSIAFTKEKLLSFYKRNNKTYFVICNDDDIIQAFVLITPITYETSQKFANNKIKDLSEIEVTDIIDEQTYTENFEKNIRQYYYLGDIVSDKNIDSRYVLVLLKKVIENYVDNIDIVYTTPVSKEGLATITFLGFEKVNPETNDLFVNYKMNILEITNKTIHSSEKNSLKKSLVANYLKKKWSGK